MTLYSDLKKYKVLNRPAYYRRGESGPKARPMKKEWVLSILEQCSKADVPFFFKQWGGVRKDLTGRKLNGRTYDEIPLDKHNYEAQLPLF